MGGLPRSLFARLISYKGESADGSGGRGGARCSAYGLREGEKWTHRVPIALLIQSFDCTYREKPVNWAYN